MDIKSVQRKHCPASKKGNIHKIEIYDELCKNIGKRILYDSYISNDFKVFQEKLIHSLEEMSILEMRNLLDELNKYSIQSKYIYTYELLNLYKDILNFHIYNQLPNRNNIDIYQSLLQSYDENNKKLILYLLYRLSNINTMNINRNEVINQCNQYLEDPLFFNYKLTRLYVKDAIFMTYSSYIKIKETEDLNLYQSTYLNYMISFCLLNGNAKREAYQLLKEELSKIPQNYFPSDLEIKFYTGLAVVAHAIEEYETAIEYFDKSMNANYLKVNYNYLILFNSLEKTKHLDRLLYLLSKIDTSKFQNELVKKIFYYYRIKYQTNLSLDNKYSLMEKCISIDLIPLIRFGEGYEKILMDELSEVVSITRNQKILFNFLKMIKGVN